MSVMIDGEKLLDILTDARLVVEADMKEFEEYEDYTLEERRFDEGYTNALLRASMEVSRLIYKG